MFKLNFNLNNCKQLAIPLLLFISSLFMNAFIFETYESVLGYEVLTFGWVGFFMGDWAWYANVCFVVACYLFASQQYLKSTVAAVVGFGLSLTALTTTQWFLGFDSGINIKALGAGFYAWALSILLVGLLAYWHDQQPRDED
ncbi:MAG: hypothetical protein HRT35_16155 [Algicola sp.]|nr:hypothetical protein [Algicola sp.]